MPTTLLIQADTMPLTVELPAIASMSHQDFVAFCEANPDLRIERSASGEVVIMAPASSGTGHRNLSIGAQLWLWAERDDTGLAFDSIAGFTLPNGAVRSPDAAWVKREKWDALSEREKTTFAPLCPDFALELRSPTDSSSVLQAKMQEYLANGAILGWLVAPQKRTVTVYSPTVAPQILENPDRVSANPELPGFSLEMRKIW